MRLSITNFACSARAWLDANSGKRLLVILGAIFVVLAGVGRADSQTRSGSRDPYARIIDRSDAIVVGRVIDSGFHEVPALGTNGRAVIAQSYMRIAVDRWLLGSDVDPVVEVRLGSELSPTALMKGKATEKDMCVIAYLLRSRGEWFLMRDLSGDPQNAPAGFEQLSTHKVNDRISAIRMESESVAPAVLAKQADLIAICELSQPSYQPYGMVCEVKKVVAGTLVGSTITVVTHTPRDLRQGEALLLLKARPDSTWELLHDGAGCYYLDQERVAHSALPLEAVLRQLATARGQGAGGVKR